MSLFPISEVAIVYSEDMISYKGKNYPKAFVANAEKPHIVQNAKRWASSSYSEYSVPKTVTTENSGFYLSLISAADDSSNGGKLSFWMCLIEKKNIPTFAVGINAPILCDLLQHATLINGKISESLFFIQKNNQIGICNKDTDCYKEMLVEIRKKEEAKQVTVKKTTKWRPGYSYYSTCTNTTMIGWFDSKLARVYQRNYKTTFELNFDAPKQAAVIDTEHIIRREESIHSLMRDAFLRDDSSWFMGKTLLDKCPSRIEAVSNIDINECYEHYISILTDMIKSEHDYLTEGLFVRCFYLFSIDPETTIEMLELLKMRRENSQYNDCYLKYNGETIEFKCYYDLITKAIEITKANIIEHSC